MKGAIAEVFGSLLDKLWHPVSYAFAPREFKQQLQRFAPQFSGYAQHDTQEFLAFLLDGLHEDLNRVLKKPYIETPDWNGESDQDLVKHAVTAWEGYKKRNDSVIVDLFQGQYKSTLVCPECEKVCFQVSPIRSTDAFSTDLYNIRSIYVPYIAASRSEVMGTCRALGSL